jgi:hypothetical protein
MFSPNTLSKAIYESSNDYVSVVGEHSVRVEAVPEGAVDFTEERMLA